MDEDYSAQGLEMLVDALRLVAADADVQEEALPAWVPVADEVALVFDDAFQTVPFLVKGGRLDRDQERSVRRVDAYFDDLTSLGDESNLWTVEALRSDPRWERARRLATEALAAIGRPVVPPSMAFGTYVPLDGDAHSES